MSRTAAKTEAASPEKILRETAELWRLGFYDPFGYFDQQQAAIETLRNQAVKYLLYGGGAGGGKSWLGWEWLIWLSFNYPETRYFVGREELKRLRRTTYQTFLKVCKKYRIKYGRDYTVNNQDNFIRFSNGSQVDLLDLRYLPSDPLFERFGSYEYTSGWIEEAGEVLFGAYDVLKSRIGRQKNDHYGLPSKLLLTCNPKKGYLKRLWVDPSRSGQLPAHMAFIPSLAVNNVHIDSGYLENLENLSDDSLKARLLYGEWDYEANPLRLINDKGIQNLFSNTYVRDRQAACYITADAARYGADRFVMMVWRGWEVVEVAVIGKSSLEVAAREIERLREKWGVPASQVVVDDDGLGGGVVDFSPGYLGFVNGQGVAEEYANLATLCAFKMAEQINRGRVYVSADMKEEERDFLVADMEAIERLPREPGSPHRLLAKERVKAKNGGRSPDFWDALKMRWAFEREALDWSVFADL